MNYYLTEEQQMIVDLVKKIAEEKIKPVRAELDEKGQFPHEIMRIFAESDLCGLYIPQEYGGFGGGEMEFCLAVEEISRVCGGVGVTFAASALGAIPILYYGSEEQKKKFLPGIAAGKKLAAFAITESEAGSDASAMKTRAVKDGNHYVLNGTKQWITNGGDADIYTVIAMTHPEKGSRGATAFIVEKGTPGFSFGKKENKMGIRASSTCELIFEDCRIPAENVISREGMGFIIALKTLDVTRPGIAAQAVGIAQGALEEAIDYARSRVQYEKQIIMFQAIQHMLADMATQIEVARSFVYSVAKTIDSGEKEYSKISAMAKLFASEMCMKVTTDAVQIMGGYGYMKDYPVEKMMRDAKVTQIYEGTSQIQRNVIAANLIKETIKKK